MVLNLLIVVLAVHQKLEDVKKYQNVTTTVMAIDLTFGKEDAFIENNVLLARNGTNMLKGVLCSGIGATKILLKNSIFMVCV